MPYIARDGDGKIVAVAEVQSAELKEWVDEGSRELSVFLLDKVLGKDPADSRTVRALGESDQTMIRVVEDVVDLLIEQNLLRFTDLPTAAQEKLLQRRSLRKSINPLGLMTGDEDSGVI